MLRNRLGKNNLKAVKGCPVHYVVDNLKLIPHLSLFHLRIANRKFEQIGPAVKEVIKNYHPFRLKSIKLVKYKKDLVLYYRLSKPAILSKLNNEIVKKCHKFRIGELFVWYKKCQFSKIDRQYIHEYGSYWSVGKNFVPHLTMVKYKVPSDKAKIMWGIGDFKFDFIANTIAICEINKHGQVLKILKTFKLHG